MAAAVSVVHERCDDVMLRQHWGSGSTEEWHEDIAGPSRVQQAQQAGNHLWLSSLEELPAAQAALKDLSIASLI
jgi:hypothetical protein